MAITMTGVERETIIIMNEAEDTAWVDTFSPVQIRHMNKLMEENPDAVKVLMKDTDTEKPYMRYEVPKKWISIRRPRRVSEEARIAAGKRLNAMRNKNSEVE